MPANLIYLYRASSDDSSVIPTLWPSELLVPPLFTNRLPWSRGYFQTVGHAPLTRWDVLPTHIFFRLMPEQFVDEDGQRVPDPGYAVAPYGLGSFRAIDDAVSAALGIPLAPDDPRPERDGAAARKQA